MTVSLSSQIAAVDAFLRKNCVIEGGSKGQLHREHMKAVLLTLQWLQANEAKIKGKVGGQP